ncbi:MAG: putative zinc-binding metallopeptidase [Deltaproteobacteria bacterium]|nr:putative zinc-binding metallopeptidase [Deltaproteobacteria bacterium]MBK8695345.1 putative zinc-binding metallopeptidase [Deltaproteobacteria bacterium]
MTIVASSLRDSLGELLDRARQHLAVIPMSEVNHAFYLARKDLRAVGLLKNDQYLGLIDCYRMPLPSLRGELGYVFDESVPWFLRLANVEPGMIYLPRNAPVTSTKGDTLVDTIRHEYGHAWAWLDRPFIERRWFRDTFGARYGNECDEAPEYDRANFVSAYACTSAAEDFCETFMTYLRCRRSLHRFDRRPGVRRKLDAVATAVAIAARDRAPRVRRPR